MNLQEQYEQLEGVADDLYDDKPAATEMLRVGQVAQRLEAIEAENAQLRKLCREAYHELNCSDDGDVCDRTHFCGRCDNSIDRNGTLRGKIARQLRENNELHRLTLKEQENIYD